jgi:hypothetical protein
LLAFLYRNDIGAAHRRQSSAPRGRAGHRTQRAGASFVERHHLGRALQPHRVVPLPRKPV